MGLELLAALFDALAFCGMICFPLLFAVDFLKQRYVRKLCKYRGARQKTGRACVICAYHHDCSRAKQSEAYRAYSYYRRVLPDQAKEIFDEIWEEEKAKKP